MKKIFLLSLISAWLFTSCTRDSVQSEANPFVESVEGTTEIKPDVTAEAFFQQLAPLSLPFTATCRFDYHDASHADTTTAGSFLKSSETTYKKITVNENVEAFIALFPADETLPRLRTYTKAGVLIDEHDLKFNPCRDDPGYSHREQYQITKDLNILHVDSTTRWQVDAAMNEVAGTRKLIVTRKQFKLYPNGEIIEIK